MKGILRLISAQAIAIMMFPVVTGQAASQQLTAKEIVTRADEKYNGEMSGYSVMSMIIVRPTWQRTVEIKSWSLGDDYSLALITAPAREKGQTFLKRGSEMWSWNPAINRLIKLPPSMMSQGWMGSDYTNDDILNESSVINDYTHTLEGEEEVDGSTCYWIKLTARPDAEVIWGHQMWWVDKKEFVVLRAELYDEDGYLVRTERGMELKSFDGRVLPSRIELVPAENEGHKTILRIDAMKFNIDIDESFFSQQNMKTIR